MLYRGSLSEFDGGNPEETRLGIRRGHTHRTCDGEEMVQTTNTADVVAAKAVAGKLIRRLQVRVLPGVQFSCRCVILKGQLRMEQHGDVAEWLGKGLQNPVRRFESARHLVEKPSCPPGQGAFLI